MAQTDTSDLTKFPVWTDKSGNDVQSLFKDPYFIPAEVRQAVAKGWYDGMNVTSGFPPQIILYDVDETKPDNTVLAHAKDIYRVLTPSGSPHMPDPVPAYKEKVQFPHEALEKIRLWYNQGGRRTQADAYDMNKFPKDPIEPPAPPKTRDFKVPDHPVWHAGDGDDDIEMAFTNPCWIPYGSDKAQGWQRAMHNFQYDAKVDPPTMFDLTNYEHIKGWARTVYDHIASKSMPIEPPFFSKEAVEAFRLWFNAGCPKDKTTPVNPADIPKNLIPAGLAPEPPFRVRKDINTLTDSELLQYRKAIMNMRTDDVDNSPWQVGGFLHANWCLHYMQASFPWHRAHLLWLETQIGMPIPYWNFYSSQATNPDSADSGIPKAFLDDMFVDTDSSQDPKPIYKNPLRWAMGRNGVSRAWTADNPQREVQRAAALALGADPAKRADYIQQHVPEFLTQIFTATTMNSIGDPQGAGNAFTFAQADLTAENKAEFYQGHQHEFDGQLEQAHDNLHGWSGPDMANNSFAAFDPLFWSFHANFDRIFEDWLRKHQAQDWTSNFPLRPFKGREGPIEVIEGDPMEYKYTNIGDMVRNCKTLGYTYWKPGNDDFDVPSENRSDEPAPIVLFPNTKCTDKTYTIDVAIDIDDGKPATPLVVGDKGYVGRITRLGMGPDSGNNRCIQGGVVRRLEASKAAKDMGKLQAGMEIKLKLLVMQDIPGQPDKEIPKTEYDTWAGFTPLVFWDKPVAGIIAQ